MRKAAIAAAAALAAVLGPSYWAYSKAFSGKKSRGRGDLDIKFRGQMLREKDRVIKLIEDLQKRPFEEIETRSFDGLRLAGSFYRKDDVSPVAICFHGWRGTPRRDFSGGAAILMDAGYNVILVDERGQGRSGGNVMTFGVKERYDVVTWARWAADRFGPERPLILVGVSMGASSVLMASCLDLPESVRCIIADSPYDSPREIIRKVAAEDLGLPPALMVYASLGAAVFGRFRLEDIKASECVKGAGVPMLIIHGLADDFVPERMSAKIAAARPDLIRRKTFPGAEHGLSFLTDAERYEAETLGFLSDVLGEEKAPGAE